MNRIVQFFILLQLLCLLNIYCSLKAYSLPKEEPLREEHGTLDYRNGLISSYPNEATTFSVQTFLQSKYTFSDYDRSRNTSNFSIPAARLMLQGSTLYNEFSYLVSPELSSNSSDSENTLSPHLLDAYISWHPCTCSALTIGQLKTPVSRQFNSLDYKLQFAENSLISDFFQQGRQQGLNYYYKFLDDTLITNAGIYNGESTTEGKNLPSIDTNHLTTLSIRYEPLGKISVLEEGDVNYTENLSVSFGGAFAYSEYNNISEQSADSQTYNIDANIKYLGASLQSELFLSSHNTDNEDSNPLGYYVQAGYFIIPKKWEVAARYGYLDQDKSTQNHQSTLGLNYFFSEHNLKMQVNYDIINSEENQNLNDNQTEIPEKKISLLLSAWF
jgi:phosphate-selective porin OprO and OprP